MRSKFLGEGDVPDALLKTYAYGQYMALYSIIGVDSYPRLTPSICKSTHQIPGMPSMDHSTVFLIKEFTGSHEKRSRYVRPTAMRRGTRQRKRNAWKGR